MHLEAIAKLPLWRLDLVNNGVIVFDPGQLEVTDAATRESFSFRGWRLGVAQLAGGGHGPGAQEGVTNLTVRSEDPPTIGIELISQNVQWSCVAWPATGPTPNAAESLPSGCTPTFTTALGPALDGQLAAGPRVG